MTELERPIYITTPLYYVNDELHIGHAIVSRAVFTGLREAVREMKALMRGAAGQAG